MKKSQTITLLAISVFFSGYLFAVDTTKKPETSENVSSAMLESIDNDVKLTEQQKVVLKSKTNVYAEKLMKARTMSDTLAAVIMMNDARGQYEQSLDSILTINQKELRNKKIDDLLLEANEMAEKEAKKINRKMY